MMVGDTTRNMHSLFPEINKLINVAYCWKYIKRNILAMHGPLDVEKKLHSKSNLNTNYDYEPDNQKHHFLLTAFNIKYFIPHSLAWR